MNLVELGVLVMVFIGSFAPGFVLLLLVRRTYRWFGSKGSSAIDPSELIGVIRLLRAVGVEHNHRRIRRVQANRLRRRLSRRLRRRQPGTWIILRPIELRRVRRLADAHAQRFLSFCERRQLNRVHTLTEVLELDRRLAASPTT